VCITHPFHPLKGQTFEMISHGPHWGEDRVVYRAVDGTLPSIASAMTDMAQADAFQRVSAGRAAFRMVDLIDLMLLLDRLSAPVEADNE
jgi:predicted GNAT family acetyltransferase